MVESVSVDKTIVKQLHLIPHEKNAVAHSAFVFSLSLNKYEICVDHATLGIPRHLHYSHTIIDSSKSGSCFALFMFEQRKNENTNSTKQKDQKNREYEEMNSKTMRDKYRVRLSRVITG